MRTGISIGLAGTEVEAAGNSSMTTTCEFILVNEGLGTELLGSVVEVTGMISVLVGIFCASLSPVESIAARLLRVGDGGVEEAFPRFLRGEDGGVDGFWVCCGGVDGFWDLEGGVEGLTALFEWDLPELFTPDVEESSVVCAVRPTGLSTMVKRFGVLTVVSFRSRLTDFKRARSVDSRGELTRLLSEPVNAMF